MGETAIATHEPTAKHLRERVEGPVVVWDLPDVDQQARALAVADVVNTWLMPELFTVVLAHPPLSVPSAEALRRLAADLNLTSSWIIPDPQPGQRQALAQRALVWLTQMPAAPVASISEALEDLVKRRVDQSLVG